MFDRVAFLWKSYKITGDIDSRNKLISYYYPFVKNIVRKIYYTLPRSVDVSDIENYAHIGLIDAIKKFNLKKNIKFETYANFRIRGAIFDGMRQQDWLPRTLRSKMKKNGSENNGNGDGPDTNDLTAERRNGTQDNGIENYVLLSLDKINFCEDGSTLKLNNSMDQMEEGIISHADFVEKVENKIFIKEIISVLSFKERKVIYLYYFRGKTFKEIGKIMDVTESRISQIHKKALITLRKSVCSLSKSAS